MLFLVKEICTNSQDTNMAFLKALLLEIFRPFFCSFAGIRRTILFKYLDWKERKQSSSKAAPK